MTEAFEIAVDDDRRLLVEQWDNGRGRRYVTVAPQYQERGGEWRLAHSGLIITPDVARQLSPALVAVAAQIDDHVYEPTPTEQDREESRMP